MTLKDLESDYASAPSDCTNPGVLARITRRYNLPLATLSALIALAALFLSAGPAEAQSAAAGSLDTSFGPGKVTTDFNKGHDYGKAVAVQPDGKIVVAGYAASGNDYYFELARYTADGVLDTTFGSGGLVTTNFGHGNDQAHAVALQSDGKIVAAGYSYNGSDEDFALARYTAEGVLDQTFGSGGLVATDSGHGDDEAHAVALQSDGKIVAAGSGGIGLARYTTSGELDATFGDGGKVTTGIYAHAVALQSDGKIVVAGYSGGNSVLARYTPAGEPDAAFGDGGKVTTDFDSGSDHANAVVVQSDGKIIVTWLSVPPRSNHDFGLARYTAAGELDAAFGNGGKVATDFDSGYDRANAVAVQSDGKIVVAGHSHNGSDNDFALARYTATGQLDAAFGNGGKVTTPIGKSNDHGYAVAVQPGGKIVVAGYSHNGSDYDFALARYTRAGSLDPSFGSPGKVTTDFNKGHDYGKAVAVQPDGKMVVAGYAASGNDYYFELARYTADGVLDETFGSGGLVTTNFGHGNDQAHAVALQSDGKIVAAGYSYNGSDEDFGLARYTAEGVLDQTFGSGGLVATDSGHGDDEAHAVALQSDGKIVAAGSGGIGLARYTTSGELDATFGDGGKVTTGIYAHAVALQSDGKIVVAGYSGGNSALARYTAAGELDAAFGDGGKVTTDFDSGSDQANAVAVQSDGKIIVTWLSVPPRSNHDFGLARYTAAGELDAAFGNGGKVATDFDSGYDRANAVAVQSDGKIVVAGHSHNGSDNDFALARYTVTGQLDAAFGNGGKVTTPIGKSNDHGYAVAVQPGRKIVVAGYSHNGSDYDFALARYHRGELRLQLQLVISSDASLSALSLSAGSIAPSFSATTYAYTLTMGSDVTSTTVTATANHGAATLKAGLSGSLTDITSGTASEAISLAVGDNTVQVEVTAEDGTTKQTYAVTVTVVEIPGPVIGLTLENTPDGLTVSWQPPDTGGVVNNYIVYARPEKSGTGSGMTKTPKASKMSTTFPNVETGMTYNVWVRAENEAGKSERVKATITLDPAPTEAPGPVVNLQLAATTGSVTATWEAPDTGGAPTRYIAHIRPEGGTEGSGETKHPKTKKRETTFRDLEAGQTYKVWVRGENAVGKGERVNATITLPE